MDDHFQENEGMEASGGLPAITLHGLSPDIFTHVLYYIYSDHTEVHAGAGCVYWVGGWAMTVVRTSAQPMSLWGFKGVSSS